MPRYLSTRGKSSLAIAVCDRCHFKTAYSDLQEDGNVKGLRVCRRPGCRDVYDPWRLPARQPERINLRNPRPDTRIGVFDQFLITEEEQILITESGIPIITQEQLNI